ncbi:MAG TPA: hypothetical protein VHV32_18940 [Candidatus Angelobacter sp.]|jgi:hypothetical protein|nr:hypothetical protein [Candidatus Angelobacter sp.]
MTNIYVLVAALLAFIGLAGYAAYEHQAVQLVEARAAKTESDNQSLRQSLTESQAAQEEERQKEAALDARLVARDKREQSLVLAKVTIQKELDALKQTLPQPDQECLNRPLPASLVERLRIDPALNDHENGAGASPAVPAHPLLDKPVTERNL